MALAQGYPLYWGNLNGVMLVPILYILALVTSKCLILNLFLTIFTLGLERMITQAIGVVVLVQGIIGIFMHIFQCNPIADAWMALDRRNCLDMPSIFKYNCLPVVITDFIMLVLPLYRIWTLKASRKFKMKVSCILLMATM